MSSFNLFNDFKEFLAKHNDLEEFKSIMSLIESSLDLYKADPDNFIENISKRKFRKNKENNLQSVSTILNDTSTDTTENYFYTLKLKLKSKRLNSTNQDSNNQPVSSIEPERNLQEISNKGINSSLLNRAKFCDNKNLSKTLRRYILKDMSLVEEIWDNFETDDEYLIYNKSSVFAEVHPAGKVKSEKEKIEDLIEDLNDFTIDDPTEEFDFDDLENDVVEPLADGSLEDLEPVLPVGL
ncbi:unnamed protein product [Brachionus calyciflorus]|uniref:Uncharacterized protein n=1 Tax=Brachionus calyciflorus TaxID=104777 RepID=A0A813QN49_9BILA|nr:unnamed protein product [Brachionus calyciflorus]